MYHLIRIIALIVAVSLFIAISYLLKFKIDKRKRNKVIIVVLIVLCLDFIYPMENLFYSFPTPAAAYKYSEYGKMLFTVEGLYSAQVVSGTKNNTTLNWFTKSDSGWKLVNINMPTFIKSQSFPFKRGEVSIFIMQYMFVNDYFILLNVNYQILPSDIQDSRNSSLYFIEDTDSHPKIRSTSIYTCIQDINKGYSIFIDGEEIVIVNPKIE